MTKIVAIHQPNLFPWLGYFDKLARADVFIVLDDVQFPKKQGSWGNRMRLLVNGQARWATMPVDRDFSGTRRFDEMRIANLPWRRDWVRTLQMNYGRTAAFDEVFPLIETLINNDDDRLVPYNLRALQAISVELGIPWSKTVCSSMFGRQEQATDLLIALVRAVGGTAYLCGGGSGGYIEPDKFAAAGIDLIYQNFVHPQYSQSGATEFVGGLSCLDALFHGGFATVAAYLKPSVVADGAVRRAA